MHSSSPQKSDAGELFSQVEKYLNTNRRTRAEIILLRVFNWFSNDAGVLDRLATVHREIGNNEAAVHAYRTIANIYSRAGAVQDEIDALYSALSIDPDNRDVHEQLIELFERHEHYVYAIEHLRRLAHLYDARAEWETAQSLRAKASVLQATRVQPTLGPDRSESITSPLTSQPSIPPSHASETMPLSVFLCHAREDKSAVRILYRRLKDDGFLPWLDEEDLTPGEEWGTAIRDAVRRCDAIVVCLSKRVVSKAGYVQREIKMALEILEEQPEGVIFIVPARLDDCIVPSSLSRLHYTDLFVDTGYDKLRSALHRRKKQLER